MRPLALLLLLLAGPLAAQTAHVRVNAPAGAVLIDGTVAGAPGEWLAVDPGPRTVSLVNDARAFDPLRNDRAVTLAEGDSLLLALALPARVRVESLPIQALVVRDVDGRRDTLGTTPLAIDAAPGVVIDLEASRDGYATVRQAVTAGEGGVTLLLPLGANTIAEAALLPTQRSTRVRTLIDFGIGAATLAAGAAAVYIKFEADAADDRYRNESSSDFGDETFLQEANRLDRLSAVALGAMQVGLGTLAIRFVLR